MAHRWGAEKVSKWEVKKGTYDLGLAEDLYTFLSTLPEPGNLYKENVINPKGQEAEIYHLEYASPRGGPRLYHGTTYLGLPNILRHGLRASCVPDWAESRKCMPRNSCCCFLVVPSAKRSFEVSPLIGLRAPPAPMYVPLCSRS